MNVTIELDNASKETMLPKEKDFRHWTESALKALAAQKGHEAPAGSELSIRLVDEAESARLNEQYRHRQGPTNVLSFPCKGIPVTGVDLMGDLAICAPVVNREAQEQQKSRDSHWAHMTIHGVLHLQGYDHEQSQAAEQMEALEISIMKSLGYKNPYLVDMKGDE